MLMNPDDTRAIREQMERLVKLAAVAAMAPDTDQMARALWALSLSVADARALVKAVEDNTRNAALNEAVGAHLASFQTDAARSAQ